MTFPSRMLGIMIPAVGLALVLAGCAKPPAPAAPQSPRPAVSDEQAKTVVVARVNGADITLQQLRMMMNRLTVMNQHASKPAAQDEIRKRALDQLVLQELALQEAARLEMRAEKADVDRAMEKVVTQLGHEEGYRDFLEKRHMTDAEMRTFVERSILTQRIFTREVTDKVSVSDDDIRQAYERERDRLVVPERIAAIDVVLFLPEGDPGALKKANEVRDRIIADAKGDPHALAPDGSFIVQDIDLDADQEPALAAAARKLQAGELSGVVQGRDSMHIIKLKAYAPRKQMSYDDVKGSLEARIRAEKQVKRRLEWETQLKEGAAIVLVSDAE
jgi:parvulin-like peptidyl-prolyl isomerase